MYILYKHYIILAALVSHLVKLTLTDVYHIKYYAYMPMQSFILVSCNFFYTTTLLMPSFSTDQLIVLEEGTRGATLKLQERNLDKTFSNVAGPLSSSQTLDNDVAATETYLTSNTFEKNTNNIEISETTPSHSYSDKKLLNVSKTKNYTSENSKHLSSDLKRHTDTTTDTVNLAYIHRLDDENDRIGDDEITSVDTANKEVRQYKSAYSSAVPQGYDNTLGLEIVQTLHDFSGSNLLFSDIVQNDGMYQNSYEINSPLDRYAKTAGHTLEKTNEKPNERLSLFSADAIQNSLSVLSSPPNFDIESGYSMHQTATNENIDKESVLHHSASDRQSEQYSSTVNTTPSPYQTTTSPGDFFSFLITTIRNTFSWWGTSKQSSTVKSPLPADASTISFPIKSSMLTNEETKFNAMQDKDSLTNDSSTLIMTNTYDSVTDVEDATVRSVKTAISTEPIASQHNGNDIKPSKTWLPFSGAGNCVTLVSTTQIYISKISCGSMISSILPNEEEHSKHDKINEQIMSIAGKVNISIRASTFQSSNSELYVVSDTDKKPHEQLTASKENYEESFRLASLPTEISSSIESNTHDTEWILSSSMTTLSQSPLFYDVSYITSMRSMSHLSPLTNTRHSTLSPIESINLKSITHASVTPSEHLSTLLSEISSHSPLKISSDESLRPTSSSALQSTTNGKITETNLSLPPGMVLDSTKHDPATDTLQVDMDVSVSASEFFRESAVSTSFYSDKAVRVTSKIDHTPPVFKSSLGQSSLEIESLVLKSQVTEVDIMPTKSESATDATHQIRSMDIVKALTTHAIDNNMYTKGVLPQSSGDDLSTFDNVQDKTTTAFEDGRFSKHNIRQAQLQEIATKDVDTSDDATTSVMLKQIQNIGNTETDGETVTKDAFIESTTKQNTAETKTKTDVVESTANQIYVSTKASYKNLITQKPILKTTVNEKIELTTQRTTNANLNNEIATTVSAKVSDPIASKTKGGKTLATDLLMEESALKNEINDKPLRLDTTKAKYTSTYTERDKPNSTLTEKEKNQQKSDFKTSNSSGKARSFNEIPAVKKKGDHSALTSKHRQSKTRSMVLSASPIYSELRLLTDMLLTACVDFFQNVAKAF